MLLCEKCFFAFSFQSHWSLLRTLFLHFSLLGQTSVTPSLVCLSKTSGNRRVEELMVNGGRNGVCGAPEGVCWWLSTGWLLWLSVIRVWERRASKGFQTGCLEKIIEPEPELALQWSFRRRRKKEGIDNFILTRWNAKTKNVTLKGNEIELNLTATYTMIWKLETSKCTYMNDRFWALLM